MKKLIENYTAPTTDDLVRLKEQLGFTGNQMADLAMLAGNSQWRKYTGGSSPRSISPHMLFFIAAQLTLSDDELKKIIDKMIDIGAIIE